MDRSWSIVGRIVSVLVGLLYAGDAAAVCDEDGDGFYGAHPGCLPRLDCDDTPITGAYVNPGEYEDPDTVVDDNCNGRRGLVPLWVMGTFPLGAGLWPTWVKIGVVSSSGDELSVGSQSTNSPSSTTKSVNIPLPVAAAVAVKVTHDVGTGSPCQARVTTPSVSISTLLDGVGIHQVELGGVYPTAPMGLGKVTSLQVACPGYRSVTVD